MLKSTPYFLLFLLIFNTFSLLSSNEFQSTQARRAHRFYQRALDHYKKPDYKQALRFLEKSVAADTSYIPAYLLAGDISKELNDNSNAIAYYKKAIALNPDHYPPALYIIGNLYYKEGFYEEARKSLLQYSKYNLQPAEQIIVDRRLRNATAASDLKKNPVPFNPVNLCHNINSQNDEYMNAISADGQTLIFTVRSPQTQVGSQRQFREEFFISTRDEGEWSKAQPMNYPSEGSRSEGALALSYDNRHMFFTACHRPDGYGSCDLYYSIRKGETWSEPENLGPVVNSSRWESQPSLSSDGRTLYFASNRGGGFGGSDIWKTILQHDGSWSIPENLGEVINTAEDEMSPYIHADGQTLYFSSKGHPGLGGADLFVSRLQQDDTWSKPANLGYPINTMMDEINLIVDPDGTRAYISSDIPEGKGGMDIYVFELHKAIKPRPVSYVKGTVRCATTLKPLGAGMELFELENGKTVIQSQSDAISGEFLTVLPSGSNYALYVNRTGYLFYSHHFALDTITGLFDPLILDVMLKPIEHGQSSILKNVFFEHNSFELKPESLTELTRLVNFMLENPGIGLEISGHSDNTGTSAYNLTLSTNRAKAVFDFLIGEGIEINRISYIGLAETSPVDTNNTPEGRANNRRTEFKINNQKSN